MTDKLRADLVAALNDVKEAIMAKAKQDKPVITKPDGTQTTNPDKAVANAQKAVNQAHADKQPTHRRSADDGAAELRRVPQHPKFPNAFGSAPEPDGIPVGKQDEPVQYITDDIDLEGTPLVQQKVTPQDIAKPNFNGETSAPMPEGHSTTEADVAAPDEPVVVSTEDGAEVERQKQPGKEVVVEPKIEDLHEGGVVPADSPDKNRV